MFRNTKNYFDPENMDYRIEFEKCNIVHPYLTPACYPKQVVFFVCFSKSRKRRQMTIHPFCQSAHKWHSRLWTVWGNMRTWREASVLNPTQKDHGGSRTHNLLTVMVPVTALSRHPSHPRWRPSNYCLPVGFDQTSFCHSQGFHSIGAEWQVPTCEINNCPFNCFIYFCLLLTVFLSTSRVGGK